MFWCLFLENRENFDVHVTLFEIVHGKQRLSGAVLLILWNWRKCNRIRAIVILSITNYISSIFLVLVRSFPFDDDARWLFLFFFSSSFAIFILLPLMRAPVKLIYGYLCNTMMIVINLIFSQSRTIHLPWRFVLMSCSGFASWRLLWSFMSTTAIYDRSMVRTTLWEFFDKMLYNSKVQTSYNVCGQTSIWTMAIVEAQIVFFLVTF